VTKTSRQSRSSKADNESYVRLLRKIGANMRRMRREKGLVQEDMIEFGFDWRWYQRIEAGRYPITLRTLNRVARALKVDHAEFFRG
jgi:transcriptional regulator with XRE-family HTH domain